MKLSLAQVAIKYGTKVQFVSAISLLRSKFFFLLRTILLWNLQSPCRHCNRASWRFPTAEIWLLNSVSGKFTTTTRLAQKYALWKMWTVKRKKEANEVHIFPVRMKCYFRSSCFFFAAVAAAAVQLECSSWVRYPETACIYRKCGLHIDSELNARLNIRVRGLVSFFFLASVCFFMHIHTHTLKFHRGTSFFRSFTTRYQVVNNLCECVCVWHKRILIISLDFEYLKNVQYINRSLRRFFIINIVINIFRFLPHPKKRQVRVFGIEMRHDEKKLY